MSKSQLIELAILKACVDRHRIVTVTAQSPSKEDYGVDIRPLIAASSSEVLTQDELNYEASRWIKRLSVPNIGCPLRPSSKPYSLRAYEDALRNPPDPAWARIRALESEIAMMEQAKVSSAVVPITSGTNAGGAPLAIPMVAIVVPLEEEFEQLLKTMPRKNSFKGLNHFHELQSPNAALRVVASFLDEPGIAAALARTGELIAQCDPILIVCAGIAGGIRDVRTGDVAIATLVNEFDANRKATPEGEKFSGSQWPADAALMKRIANFAYSHADYLAAWREASVPARPKSVTWQPMIHRGKIASGDIVVASKEYRDDVLGGIDRKFLCVEMEGAGVARVAHDHRIPWLVIRGISDMADEKKTIHDEDEAGVGRAYPALSAFTLVRAFLASGILAERQRDAPNEEGPPKAHDDMSLAAPSVKDEVRVAPAEPTLSPERFLRFEDSMVFFHERMCDAFPGVRGLRKFATAEAIPRLAILLAQPLKFRDKPGMDGFVEPIWLLLEAGSTSISRSSVVDTQTMLLGIDRIRVGEIWAYRAPSYKRDFVLLELLPDEPTGLYPGAQYEEYGVSPGGDLYSREEFDDGSATRNGAIKAIEEETRLETRLLRRGFVILTGQGSSLHLKHEPRRQEILNDLVAATASVDDLIALFDVS